MHCIHWKQSSRICSVSLRFVDVLLGSTRKFSILVLCSMFLSYTEDKKDSHLILHLKSILDSIVVSSMPEHERSNFGRVRLWGELGNGVSSSIMMSLINSDRYGFGVSPRRTPAFVKCVYLTLPLLDLVPILRTCRSFMHCICVSRFFCT